MTTRAGPRQVANPSAVRRRTHPPTPAAVAMRLTPRLLALVATAALAACDSNPTDAGGDCTTEAVPGLAVLVSDSLSGNAPAAVLVRATSGAFVDSSSAGIANSAGGPVGFSLAFEHAGTYTVTVEAPRFRPWTRSGIVVTSGSCHVRTVTVTARLQQQP